MGTKIILLSGTEIIVTQSIVEIETIQNDMYGYTDLNRLSDNKLIKIKVEHIVFKEEL